MIWFFVASAWFYCVRGPRTSYINIHSTWYLYICVCVYMSPYMTCAYEYSLEQYKYDEATQYSKYIVPCRVLVPGTSTPSIIIHTGLTGDGKMNAVQVAIRKQQYRGFCSPFLLKTQNRNTSIQNDRRRVCLPSV